MSTTQEKKQQFTVEIRRKNLNERMSNMRAQLLNQNSKEQNSKLQLSQLMRNITAQNFTEYLSKLKVLSFNVEAPQQMVSMLNNICSVVASTQSPSQFYDAISILINMSVVLTIFVSKQFLRQIVKMILMPQRQSLVLWLLANLLYRKNNQTKEIIAFLVSIDVINFLEVRINKTFDSKSEITIFNYFCCSLLSNAQNLTFLEYQGVLKSLQIIQKYDFEENDFYLVQSLIDHAPFIGVHQYEILGSNLFQKFSQYCKAKKSKIAKPYLECVYEFLRHDVNKDNYERVLKYGIMKNLEYCNQNRSPEIKQLCANIGSIMLENYSQKINFESESFYMFLAMEVQKIEKYQERVQVGLLVFLSTLIRISLQSGLKQEVLKLIEQTQFMLLFSNFLIDRKDRIIHIFVEIAIMVTSLDKKVRIQCGNYRIPELLEQYSTSNPELEQRIQYFLKCME